MKSIVLVLGVVTLFHTIAYGIEITLHKKDATVWAQEQVIVGEVDTATATEGLLYLDGVPQSFTISPNDSFEVPIRIGEGTHIIYVQIDSSGVPIISDTLGITLGYKLRPEVFAYATVNSRTVDLHSRLIDNPDSVDISYAWSEDPANPVIAGLTDPNDTLASLSIPEDAPHGEYYFNPHAVGTDLDSVRARTYVTVTDSGIVPFNIRTDHAAWIDSAVIYEITPYKFVSDGTLSDVTEKIPELADFGITALWLQPITKTHDGGMGYDVTDYFAVRSDYGTVAELHELIATAHAYDLKVVFDVVPNHSSIMHPHAQQTIANSTDSHYYNFYQREFDDAPYSRHYHHDLNGFVYYFWDSLLNLNYDNPEVQRWMTEVFKYWIEEFDVDGYRFDAVWGVTARRPEYTQQLRLVLKRIKPEILLLAEDKATWPMVFEERFDAAFDWAAGEDWVSQPMWAVEWSEDYSYTIFNHITTSNRAFYLRKALTNNGNGFHPRAKILRFMDNNDTFYFITHHNLKQTKMVAALMFSLHGIPMLYNGQETGMTGHPYDPGDIFRRNQSIRSLDELGLFPYYQRLIALRRQYDAFRSDNFEELDMIGSGSVFAYRRWQGKQNVFCIINMNVLSKAAELSLPIDDLDLESTRTYYLTELITGDVISGKPSELQSVNLDLAGYSTSLYLLQDTVVAVEPLRVASSSLPVSFTLGQNYPNPFNPITTIKYTLPANGFTRLVVYDLLGREVAKLVAGYQVAGSHAVDFDGSAYASGIYLYRLESAGRTQTRKMILLK